MRWSSPRPTTCTRRSRRWRWISASTSTCRSRSAGRWRKRGCWRRRPRTRKIVSQMGNQGHSLDDARTGNEYVVAGRSARSGSARLDQPPARLLAARRAASRGARADPAPLGWNGDAVDEAAGRGAGRRLSDARGARLGPVPRRSPEVEYHPIYHPFNWRGWVDWGQGALGDMGAHLVDHPFWALDLGYPTSGRDLVDAVQRRVVPVGDHDLLRVPRARQSPPVRLTWYDGGLLPPKPEDIGDERMNPGGGVLYIGTKGKLMQDTYGATPRLYPVAARGVEDPAAAEAAADRPRRARDELGRGDQGPGRDLVAVRVRGAAHRSDAARDRRAPRRPKIHYDGAKMQITNSVASSNQPLEGEQLLDGSTRRVSASLIRRRSNPSSRVRGSGVRGFAGSGFGF